MKIKIILLTGYLVALISALFWYSPPAHAQWSTDFNEITHEEKTEFYYWDGDNIVATGGIYNGDDGQIVFYPQGSNSTKFNVKGDWIPIMPGTVKKDNPNECLSLPANGRADGGIELRLNDSAGKRGGVIDVIGDGGSSSNEDGLLKWGGYRTNGWNFIGTAINGATNNRDCQYHLYDGINKRFDPYNSDYIVKGIPYAGHLLGEKGMSFEDWKDRSDRRNIYNAYKKSAGDNIRDHCSKKDDAPGCINSLSDSFERCYAKAIGSSRNHVEEDNIKSSDWQSDLNAGSLKDCMMSDKSTDKYFDGDKEDFIQKLLEDGNANIPPSIAPKLPGKEDPNTKVDEKTHCSIAKIGWIMCPALNFFAKINDKIYKILQNWMYVNPFYASAGTSKVDMSYKVWQQMRDIANVIFVLTFMVFIYSYISGKSVSLFSIRSMLPRLILTAVLVNASFYICALGVDISNVMGDSVYKVIHATTGEIKSGVDKFQSWEWVTTSIVMGGGAVAGTVIVLANLAALVPLLVSALFAMIITFVILLLRQALIILLVVISPVAFAMFLLPNTRQWFERWQKTFVSLLLLYPAIALVFAGSYFASRIIGSQASENGEVLLAIFSLAIQTIPLFISPLLIKLSGGVLNRFGGIINNPNKGPFDRLKKKANQFKDDRKQLQQTRAMNGAKGTMGVYGAFQRREARRKYKLNYHKSARDREQAIMTGSGKNAENIGNMVAGRTSGNDELKQAIQNKLQEQARSLKEGDTRVAGVLIENQLFNNQNSGFIDELTERAATGRDSSGQAISEAEQAAAIQKVVERGDIDEIHRLIDASNARSNAMGSHQREVLADAIKSSGIGRSAAHLGSEQALAGIRNGTASVDNLYSSAAQQGLYTASTAAMQDPKAIARMAQAHANGAMTDTQIASFKEQFDAATRNDRASQHISQAARDQRSRL